MDKGLERLMKQIRTVQEVDDTTSRYINCFIYDIDNSSKRFSRYVGKTKDNLLNYMKQDFPYYFETERRDDGLQDAVVQFVVELFRTHYFPFIQNDAEMQDVKTEGEDYCEERCILDFINPYEIDNFDIKYLDKEILKNILYNVDFIADKNPLFSINNLVNQEIVNACKNHIARKCADDSNLSETNYQLSVATSKRELIDILLDIIRLVYVDIERMIHTHLAEGFAENFSNETINDLKQKLSDAKNSEKTLKDEVNSQNKIITEKDFVIRELQGRLKYQEKNKDKSAEDIVVRNQELEKKYRKLSEKYALLEAKYNALKSESISEEKEEDVENKEIIEVDMNANYLFVCYDDVTFFNVITKAFPNASFASDNTPVRDTIDYVIALTNHVDHSAYNGVKAQCINRGIPFIHCPNTNVNIIKDTIFKFLNSNN